MTVGSLLLCAAVCVLWVRSYRKCDVLLGQRGYGDRVCVTSEFGVFVLEVEEPQQGFPQPGWMYFDSALPRRWRRQGGWLGFALYRGENRHYVRLPPTPLWGAAVPHGFAMLLAATLPARWLVAARQRAMRKRRTGRGLCANCGYDLRASFKRCSECGAPIGARAA